MVDWVEESARLDIKLIDKVTGYLQNALTPTLINSSMIAFMPGVLFR